MSSLFGSEFKDTEVHFTAAVFISLACGTALVTAIPVGRSVDRSFEIVLTPTRSMAMTFDTHIVLQVTSVTPP